MESIKSIKRDQKLIKKGQKVEIQKGQKKSLIFSHKTAQIWNDP